MKKVMRCFTLVCTCLFWVAAAIAQAPQGVNYQAIVRDNQGLPLINHLVSFKFNIRQSNSGGNIVYAETHSPTTDALGGVSLVIGQGTVVTGVFSNINWSTGSYFNEVLIDVNGGTNYQVMGNSKLMSVPYSLFAEKANESQTLSINGNSLSISGGNTVTLPTGGSNSNVLFTAQKISLDAYPATNIPANSNISSEPDGSIFYLTLSIPSSGFWASYISSFQKDSITGFYFKKDGTSVNSYLCGAAYTTAIGNYLYACVKPNNVCGNSVCKFYRYDKNNLGVAPVLMTVVGALPLSAGGVMFTDGTFLYVTDNGNVFKKYAISGTTLTDNGAYVMAGFSSITFPNTTSYDGTDLITYSSSDGVCSRFTLNGTLINKIVRKNNNSFDGARYANSFIVNLSANSLYLVDYCVPQNITSQGSSFDGDQFLKLTPISKP